MIKVIVGNNTHRDEMVYPTTTTVRSILEEAEVNYHVGTICLNSNMLDRSELDMTLAEFGIGDETDLAFLTVIENKNNAARIVNVMGNYVIQADFSMNDIEACEEEAPEALQVRNDSKILFAVASGEEPEIGRYGMCFARENDGHCCMDVEASSDEEFAAEYGKAIAYLKKIELQVAIAVDNMSESMFDVVEMIEHIG